MQQTIRTAEENLIIWTAVTHGHSVFRALCGFYRTCLCPELKLEEESQRTRNVAIIYNCDLNNVITISSAVLTIHRTRQFDLVVQNKTYYPICIGNLSAALFVVYIVVFEARWSVPHPERAANNNTPFGGCCLHMIYVPKTKLCSMGRQMEFLVTTSYQMVVT